MISKYGKNTIGRAGKELFYSKLNIDKNTRNAINVFKEMEKIDLTNDKEYDILNINKKKEE